MRTKRSPEEALFLELLKSFIRTEPRPSLSRGALDWKKFKALLAYHDLYPFIHAVVKESALPIPADIANFLSQNYYATIIRTQVLWRELLSVAKRFREKNIAMAPIKGASSLADIYLDNPFRPMADIDILVKKEEFLKAREILTSLGYEVSLGGPKEEYWVTSHCELTFIKKTPEGTRILDVHFGLDTPRPYASGLPKLWERTREISVEGHLLHLLSPEDQLFCLALHQRRFGGKAFCLKNIFDLAMILERTGGAFDWDYVVREARIGKMHEPVFLILAAVKTFFEAPVPGSVWTGLKIPAYKRSMAEKLIGSDALRPKPSEKEKELFLKMQWILFDGWWEPLCVILGAPIEQFSKYYGLDPYLKQTERLYQWRWLYVPYHRLFGKKNLGPSAAKKYVRRGLRRAS